MTHSKHSQREDYILNKRLTQHRRELLRKMTKALRRDANMLTQEEIDYIFACQDSDKKIVKDPKTGMYLIFYPHIRLMNRR